MDVHELVSKLKELAKDIGKTPTVNEFSTSCNISTRIIKKHGHNNLVRMAGLLINKRSQDKDPTDVQALKILIIDIETAPIIANVWGLFDQNIGLNQIVRDWFILSYSAKWMDDDTIYYLDQRYSQDISDDRQLCEAIHHLLSQAHYVCGHNVARFDLKKINARFLKHGLDPVGPFTIIDTLRIARKHFALTSNKLEYIAKMLSCTPKSAHKKFSGMDLWTECLNKNPEAFEEMENYNKQDVITTEEVMKKLLPYENITFQSFHNKAVCTCGSTEFFKNGVSYNKQGSYQVYKCRGCGKRLMSKDNLNNKTIRKGFLK
jgi:uncharacterized protein YprB with RNaseH-like and TPR domain